MKKIKKMAVVVLLVVTGSFMLGACGDPCKKAMDKVEKCSLKELPKKDHAEFKKDLPEARKMFMAECKKNKDKIKPCNKIDDCKKFNACLDKIK